MKKAIPFVQTLILIFLAGSLGAQEPFNETLIDQRQAALEAAEPEDRYILSEQLLGDIDKAFGAQSPEYAEAMIAHAEHLLDAGRDLDAVHAARQALQLAGSIFEADDHRLLRAEFALFAALVDSEIDEEETLSLARAIGPRLHVAVDSCAGSVEDCDAALVMLEQLILAQLFLNQASNTPRDPADLLLEYRTLAEGMVDLCAQNSRNSCDDAITFASGVRQDYWSVVTFESPHFNLILEELDEFLRRARPVDQQSITLLQSVLRQNTRSDLSAENRFEVFEILGPWMPHLDEVYLTRGDASGSEWLPLNPAPYRTEIRLMISRVNQQFRGSTLDPQFRKYGYDEVLTLPRFRSDGDWIDIFEAFAMAGTRVADRDGHWSEDLFTVNADMAAVLWKKAGLMMDEGSSREDVAPIIETAKNIQRMNYEKAEEKFGSAHPVTVRQFILLIQLYVSPEAAIFSDSSDWTAFFMDAENPQLIQSMIKEFLQKIDLETNENVTIQSGYSFLGYQGVDARPQLGSSDDLRFTYGFLPLLHSLEQPSDYQEIVQPAFDRLRDELSRREYEEYLDSNGQMGIKRDQAWIGFYYFLAATPSLTSTLHDDLFWAEQQLSSNSATEGIARSALSVLLLRAGLADLAERRLQIIDESTALQTLPYSSESYDAVYGLVTQLEAERYAIDRSIGEQIPGYLEYLVPTPVEFEDVGGLLENDQALVYLSSSETCTMVYFFTKESHSVNCVQALDRDRADQLVRRLLWDVGAEVDLSFDEELQANRETIGEGEHTFARDAAHELYQTLLSPHEHLLASKRHLFVVASGPLARLPLSILVTTQPDGLDGDPEALRQTDWLSDMVAVVQLPSVQALSMIRAVESGQQVSDFENFVGFGDPVLSEYSISRTTRRRAPGDRFSVDALSVEWQDFDENGSETRFLADTSAVQSLASLPGTRVELETIKDSLGGDRATIYLGGAASEARVKSSDFTGVTTISFATHGLLAGELNGLDEPALVLTPPLFPSMIDDGLLTTSEIALLELSAEFVLLSACNTAGGDGTSSNASLSGLVRSFLFAGAQSVLASHWPVRDDVAPVLTLRMIEIYRESPSTSRAEAMQRAMQEIRNDVRMDGTGETWAHPSAWAPFSFIGGVQR